MTCWRSSMPDISGRPGLGLKQPKPPKKPRRAIPKQSARKKAQKAAEKAAGAWEHMAAVKAMPCLVCGAYGVDVHHEGRPRSGFNVLPLCPKHHRREFGAGAFHYSPKAFYALHGPSDELLARVKAML